MRQTAVADLSSPLHAAAVLDLLDEYARGITGTGKPLPEFVRANLIHELSQRPDCCAVLAFVDEQPAGLAICFEGFSTFACKPILNIHDFVVAEAFRGQGLARDLLAKVEEVAKSNGCCKLTLEVLEGNERARQVYQRYGFASYELDPEMGRAVFLEKTIK
ncbi:MAG: GNAT family N-acetyltransferase [Lacipirellulaceae bacterium]